MFFCLKCFISHYCFFSVNKRQGALTATSGSLGGLRLSAHPFRPKLCSLRLTLTLGGHLTTAVAPEPSLKLLPTCARVR